MRTALFASLLMLAGCSTDPTEVMLVIDAQFAVPTEMDSLEISVSSPDGDVITHVVPLTAEDGFPRILGVLRGSGGADDYFVTIRARLGATLVLERRASFQFTKDEVRRLEIDLVRACVGVTCNGSGRTCGNAGLCDRIDIPRTVAWDGPTDSKFVDGGKSIDSIVVGP